VWRAGRLGPTAGSLLVAAALIGAVTGRPAVPYLISAGPLGLALLVGRAPQPVRRPAAFAYAAGITGTLANLLLIAFFAVQFGDPEQPVSFGTANDVVGSLASALMIPVAVALSSHLPVTAAARRAQTAGVAAMAASAVVGPLLVTGALPFEVSTAISIGALLVLAGWLVAVSRWLRRSQAVPARVARLGELSGLAFATGAAVVALGVPLPWMSVHQLVIFGVGAGVGSAAFLAIPIWFLLLGRHFPADAPAPLHRSPSPVATEVIP
jgi:MFS family permease